MEILIAVTLIYTLWLFYLGIMNLQRAHDKGTLSRPAYWLGLPLLVLGLVVDWLVNVTVCVFLFADLPREWMWLRVWRISIPYFTNELVTGRLKRYAYDPSQTWRRVLALWVARNLLDTFDPSGKHV